VILLAPALLFGWLAIMAIALLAEPPSNPERQFAVPRLVFTAPLFLVLSIYAFRNFHRLTVHAGITAADAGVSLQVPVVPFVMAPYTTVRETFVPWHEVDRRFTPGKRSKYFIASGRRDTEITPGAFDRSNYEIDNAIAAALQERGLGYGNAPPQQLLAGSSPATLLTVGGVVAGLSFVAMIAIVESAPPLAGFLSLPFIFGLALIAMGVLPGSRVIIDPRGIFVERGVELDFIPANSYDSLRANFEGMSLGVFKSGKVTAVVDGKNLRVGFNQVFGFGFPVDDIRTAFGG
jgi:hypothetical protein